MLQQEKLPYLFVALVGLFVWSLNNIIENTKNSPIIEYSFKSENDSIKQLKLTNLSSSCRLEKLTFNLCSTDSTLFSSNAFSNPVIKAIPPAYLLQSKIDTNTIAGKCFDFIIDEFQPNSEFIIKYHTLCENNGVLKLKSSSKQIVRIQKHSFLTFVLRYQIIVNAIILGLSIILLIPYYFYLKNNPTP